MAAAALTASRYDLPWIEHRIDSLLRSAISEKGVIASSLCANSTTVDPLSSLLITWYDKQGDKRYRRAIERLYESYLASFPTQADRYRLAPFYAHYARRFGKRKTGDIRKTAYTEVVAAFTDRHPLMQETEKTAYADALLTTLALFPPKEEGYKTLYKLLPEALQEVGTASVAGLRLHLTAVRHKLIHPQQHRDRLLAVYEQLRPTLAHHADRAEAIRLALEVEAVTNIDLQETIDERCLAFPTAEGGGRFTSGGRGGKVLTVTSLADDGSEGTLRWALSQRFPRTIVFAVAGYIDLTKPLKISYGNLTIAGQTAPGEGITIRRYGVEINASNVIVRYLRFRPGDVMGKEMDAFGGKGARDVIIDHCSMSWSTDECVSFYAMRNFTMQWCLIAESLASSVHAKGSHGYGGLWGGRNASFHHNLVAHHTSRNPRADHPYVYTPEQLLTHRGTVEITNNLFYNWGYKACYGGEWGWWNFVGNYYKAGPATTCHKNEFIEASVNNNTGHGTGRYFLTGNRLTSSKSSTRDNWLGMRNKGEASLDQLKSETPFPMSRGAITIESAEKAYKRVLRSVGASHLRDRIDSRLVEEVASGTTYGVGSKSGIRGIIDSQEDVGGWHPIASTEAPRDTDGDGMPDAWEQQQHLDPHNAADGATKSLDDWYTNLECYLNSLVDHIQR